MFHLKTIYFILLSMSIFALNVLGKHSSSSEEDGSSREDGCVCKTLKFLCTKGGVFCELYQDRCKCKKGSTATPGPTKTRTRPTPKINLKYCENICKPKCDQYNIGCETNDPEQVKLCEKCHDPCNALGVSIEYHVMDPPFWDQQSYCQWCHDECYSGQPNCFQSHCANCGDCDSTTSSTVSTTTPDPVVEHCLNECQPKCDGIFIGCESLDQDLVALCQECSGTCNDIGVPITFAAADPPFWDQSSYCQWCTDSCNSGQPNCFQSLCADCGTCDSSSTIKITTSPGPTMSQQFCLNECKPKCNGFPGLCKPIPANDLSTFDLCEWCMRACRTVGVKIEYAPGCERIDPDATTVASTTASEPH